MRTVTEMRVAVNGVRLFFDVVGAKLMPEGPAMRERPTLILLHGAPGLTDHSSLRPNLDHLAGLAQLVYLDLRGGGRSDAGPAAGWTVQQWADDLRAFCETLGIERPTVLGHGWGGAVAMCYAAHHPDHPAKLILAATQARLDAERVSAAFRRLGGDEAEAVARAFFAGRGDVGGLADYARVCLPLYDRTPEDLDARRRAIAQPGLFLTFHVPPDGLWHRFDLRAELPRVRCPTLVLAGEEDPVAPPEDAIDIAAVLSGASVRVVRLAGCGHSPWRDDPERTFAALRDFLRE